jgi:hypothetical protein
MQPWLLIFVVSALVFGSLDGRAASIPNASFEVQSGCPTGISQLALATPWTTPTLSSPDYMHTCSTGSADVPTNVWGSQLPFDGEGYAAVISYNSQNAEREYLQAALDAPLLAGATYEFSMRVSLAEDSGWAIDRIGAYFSIGAISSNDFWELPYIPQIENPSSNIISNDSAWTQISGLFYAAGGEDHVTIGNFRDDAGTQIVAHSGSLIGSVYYVDGIEFDLAPCPGVEIDFQGLESVSAAESVIGTSYSNSGFTFWSTFGNLESWGTLNANYAGSTMLNSEFSTVLTAANGTPATQGDMFTLHWIDLAENYLGTAPGTPIEFRGTRIDNTLVLDTVFLDGQPGPQRAQFAGMTDLWKVEWSYPLPPFPFDQYDNVCATSFPSVPAIGPPGLVLLTFALASVVMCAGWLVHRRRSLPSPDAAGV